MSIYQQIPQMEDARYLVRLVKPQDGKDLLAVYSDKNALPFFNSDNCGGDIFYYNTAEKMEAALSFWFFSYEKQYFARLAILDKIQKRVIGTVELCKRVSDDFFNGCGILRLDLGSDYEQEEVITPLLQLLKPFLFDAIGCDRIITKVPPYAVERKKAMEKTGYVPSSHCLMADGYPFNGYWILQK